MKNIYPFFLLCLSFIFSTCCGSFIEVEEFCEDQVFTESKTVPLNFTYSVNKIGKTLEAHKVTGADIQKALGVSGSNFKVKRIELTSAAVAYSKGNLNQSIGFVTSLAVVDNTSQLVPLLKKDLWLPLNDIPGTIFTPELNINKELNEKGVNELKKILAQYFDLLNNDGISFMLVGEGSPSGTLANFQLKVKLWVSVSYEVCRYVPLGTGERVCN